MVDELRAAVREARYISISLDESMAIDKTSLMSIHLHIMVGCRRVAFFVSMKAIEGAPTAATLLKTLRDELATCSNPYYIKVPD